ncbi:MAG TPA: VOC family protein [Acidimicrobiales bacterium]
MTCQARLVPELYCTDFDRSLAFYTVTLGFRVVYERRNSRFAFLEREGAQVMIEEPTEPDRVLLAAELAFPLGRGVNLQIEVGDVVELHNSVLASGAPVFLELEEREYQRLEDAVRVRQFVVQDPDGYLLRFSQDLANSDA